MSITINTRVFTADSVSPNLVQYRGPAASFSARDDLIMSRQPVKSSTVSSGNTRGMSKLTRGLTLTGAIQPRGDGTIQIDHQFPVGASDADIDAMCADAADLLASTEYKNSIKKRVINL